METGEGTLDQEVVQEIKNVLYLLLCDRMIEGMPSQTTGEVSQKTPHWIICTFVLFKTFNVFCATLNGTSSLC